MTFYEQTKLLARFDKNKIRFAMNDIERFTCIRFVERSGQRDFINIFSGDGCFSKLGRHGSQQDLSLQKEKCLNHGVIIHELVHAVGFGKILRVSIARILKLFIPAHMQSHVDRDDFIEIQWENIEDKDKKNFEKISPLIFGNFRTNYDIFSVMHYNRKAFSKNGHDTITPKDEKFNKFIGQRFGLSRGDIKRINNMYRCYQ